MNFEPRFVLWLLCAVTAVRVIYLRFKYTSQAFPRGRLQPRFLMRIIIEIAAYIALIIAWVVYWELDQ